MHAKDLIHRWTRHGRSVSAAGTDDLLDRWAPAFAVVLLVAVVSAGLVRLSAENLRGEVALEQTESSHSLAYILFGNQP